MWYQTVFMFLIAMLSIPFVGHAARSVSPDAPISVRLDPSQPTAVAMPEPVTSVSGGVSVERFSLECDGPYLFLTALDPTVSGRLFVVGQSGKLYMLLFKVATPADDVVQVAVTPTAHAARQPLSVASVLRALRTGVPLPGQQEADLPAPTLPDARLTLTGSTAISVGNLLGVLVTLRNTHAAPLVLDVRLGLPAEHADETVTLAGWVWPPRLTVKAVATDAETLAPGEVAHVTVVLEKRP
jgi:hypothetical protein